MNEYFVANSLPKLFPLLVLSVNVPAKKNQNKFSSSGAFHSIHLTFLQLFMI